MSNQEASFRSLTLHYVLNLLLEPYSAAETFPFYHVHGVLFSFCVILTLCLKCGAGEGWRRSVGLIM